MAQSCWHRRRCAYHHSGNIVGVLWPLHAQARPVLAWILHRSNDLQPDPQPHSGTQQLLRSLRCATVLEHHVGYGPGHWAVGRGRSWTGRLAVRSIHRLCPVYRGDGSATGRPWNYRPARCLGHCRFVSLGWGSGIALCAALVGRDDFIFGRRWLDCLWAGLDSSP
ncbi:uncharacterized protein BJ171DRAFT_505961 [Polychytrium aggregatum]|uniref:uncharacterized protein n=1 Tax=Polychytrium aggregatum TaxID=110093 RepID=UPI0022FE3960|nr:uncharacterized protein BJ171DRAFT_505961 [Polychytrium aggregatum]KAI9204499.1 hypothetical protein BJ171DRAFT_505961 [Polychytrium aggregatum]